MLEQFNIPVTTSFHTEDSILSMQIGTSYFSYCIYDTHHKNLLELKRYRFDRVDTEILEAIRNANPVLENAFERIITQLDFDFYTLLPAGMGDGDATPLMYLENADQQEHVISELVTEWQVINKYSVPSNILSWVLSHFPSSGYIHAQTLLVKNIPANKSNGLLRVEFTENKFSVVAVKNDQLLLAKTYSYKAPADVVFYLLKICEVFELKQEEAELLVSGLIDTDSKLYKELYDYFLHISLKQPHWQHNSSNYPTHYFTSLNELALCELLLEA